MKGNKSYYDYARQAVARLKVNNPSDRDDVIQEAAIAAFLNEGRVDTTRPERGVNSYQCGSARWGALDYLDKVRRLSRREVVCDYKDANRKPDGTSFDGYDINHQRDRLTKHEDTPEAILIAKETAPKVYRVLALGYARLTDQEKALMRFRFGWEPARADLIRLGNGCGKVSNFARKKILAVAKEHGVEEVTHNFLLTAFGADLNYGKGPRRKVKPDFSAEEVNPA